jgi:hypothetical protein
MRFQAAAKMVINEHDIHVDTSKIFIDPEGYEDESQESNRVPAETTDRLQSVSVNTKIRNHLPIGLRLMMRMATDSTKLHSAPEVVVGPLDVDPGEVNAEGQVTGAPVQDNTLEITSDMIHIFQNKTDIPKPVFIVSDLTLKDSGGNEVQVYASDFVQIEALITLIVELSDD